MIRGIAGMFGGSATANKVADMVEQVSGINLTAAQQHDTAVLDALDAAFLSE